MLEKLNDSPIAFFGHREGMAGMVVRLRVDGNPFFVDHMDKMHMVSDSLSEDDLNADDWKFGVEMGVNFVEKE